MWKLIRYLLEQSTRPSIINNYSQQALPSYIPNARELVLNYPKRADVPEMIWVDSMDYARTPYTPPISTWQAICTQHLNDLARGTVSARAVAESIARETNALLDEFYAGKK